MIQLPSLLRSVGETFASLLYPLHCANCSTTIEPPHFLCESCLTSVSRIKPPFCTTCSQPFNGAIEGTFSCANCAERQFYFEYAVSTCLSRGLVRELIHRFKYQQEYRLRHPLADWLAESLHDPRIQKLPFDFFIPVPLHPTRLREREFNQATVLAKLLSKQTGKPVLDCLQRTRYTPTQTRFDRNERMENLHNAFILRKNSNVQNMHLLLIDDVLTTCSTVNECSRVLKKAGAASIRVMTVARG